MHASKRRMPFSIFPYQRAHNMMFTCNVCTDISTEAKTYIQQACNDVSYFGSGGGWGRRQPLSAVPCRRPAKTQTHTRTRTHARTYARAHTHAQWVRKLEASLPAAAEGTGRAVGGRLSAADVAIYSFLTFAGAEGSSYFFDKVGDRLWCMCMGAVAVVGGWGLACLPACVRDSTR